MPRESKCKVDLKKPKHLRAYYNSRELDDGTRVEMEHTKNRSIARNIAMNHLDEFSDYYKNIRMTELRLKKKQTVKKR